MDVNARKPGLRVAQCCEVKKAPMSERPTAGDSVQYMNYAPDFGLWVGQDMFAIADEVIQ
jgi:hypothetical protein